MLDMAHKRGYANSENALTSEEKLITEIFDRCCPKCRSCFYKCLGDLSKTVSSCGKECCPE